MPGFTDLDLEAAIDALTPIQLTVPSKNTPSSSRITRQQLECIKTKPRLNVHIMRYSLMCSGELRIDEKKFPEEQLLATGDLFFHTNGELTGISNYIHFYHVFLVLDVLKEHGISFSNELQLLQDNPPNTFLTTSRQLSAFLQILPAGLHQSLKLINQLSLNVDEDEETEDLLEEEVFYLENAFDTPFSRQSPLSVAGFFGKHKSGERRHNNTPAGSLHHQEETALESASYNS